MQGKHAHTWCSIDSVASGCTSGTSEASQTLVTLESRNHGLRHIRNHSHIITYIGSFDAWKTDLASTSSVTDQTSGTLNIPIVLSNGHMCEI